MLISKTPFRISLFGGGTDFPHYFNRYGGKTLGFSINKYCYIFFRNGNKLMDYNYRIAYSKVEAVKKINQIEHPSVKNTCLFYNYKQPFDLLHNGDLPAKTGLGSSSSFTVGMCKIFRKLLNKNDDPYIIAKDAINIEQKKIKETVGSQDQVFASFGGFNSITFKKKDDFIVNRYFLPVEKLKQIESNFVLIFTKTTRFSGKIEKSKSKNFQNKIEYYHNIKKLADEAEHLILNKKILDIKEIGNMLNEAWESKKSLSKDVSSSYLDEIYNFGLSNGAAGGKILGAGGGGFFIFAVPDQNLKKFKKAFSKKHAIVDYKIALRGSRLI